MGIIGAITCFGLLFSKEAKIKYVLNYIEMTDTHFNSVPPTFKNMTQYRKDKKRKSPPRSQK